MSDIKTQALLSLVKIERNIRVKVVEGYPGESIYKVQVITEPTYDLSALTLDEQEYLVTEMLAGRVQL